MDRLIYSAHPHYMWQFIVEVLVSYKSDLLLTMGTLSKVILKRHFEFKLAEVFVRVHKKLSKGCRSLNL